MQVSQEQADKVLFIFAITLVMYAQSFTDTSRCGEKYSTRMDQDVFSKHRLRSRVIESQPISRPLECYIKCMKNCRCVSYNVCNGGKLCELNSEKKENNTSLYEASDECDYHEYEFSKQGGSDSCSDTCCSTSNPCLNNGSCQATCMKNGYRFKCQNCADGYEGNRCEKVPRSCAAYANSPNRKPGRDDKIIYGPDNTPYKVVCFFPNNGKVRTMVMSFTRVNSPDLSSHSLAEDNPMNENTLQFEKYRLSLARMKSIRDNSSQWFYTCNFGASSVWEDSLQSKLSKTDPLTYDSSNEDDCRRVALVKIRGKMCTSCHVGMTQTTGSILRVANNNVNCGGLGVGIYTCSTNGVPVTYFGDYTCYISSFPCSANNFATTQLWFSD